MQLLGTKLLDDFDGVDGPISVRNGVGSFHSVMAHKPVLTWLIGRYALADILLANFQSNAYF